MFFLEVGHLRTTELVCFDTHIGYGKKPHYYYSSDIFLPQSGHFSVE